MELESTTRSRAMPMIAVTFLSKLRFSADQNPEPGDAVIAHVLDVGLGRPRMRLAYCGSDGEWSCAETGAALAPRGSRSLVMGWVPNDGDQEAKYRQRFGL
jgi:hypothetical protein